MEWEKNIFCVYLATSAYHVVLKEVENRIFRDNHIFRHIPMCKQLILTKKWNYSIFVQTLYSYLTCSDRLVGGCVFLVACGNIIRVSWEIKKEKLSYRKKYMEEWVWRTSHFWLHTLFPMSFFVPFESTPSLFPDDILAEWPL